MNKDVVILRESIKKLVPMIASKGLRVTQVGTGAYVVADPKTGIPVRVNIPSIPDNAEIDFIHAIQGFIDHEVAHVLFTDFMHEVKARQRTPELHSLHNIIEDTMIERLIGKQFPGSRKNIARLRDHFLTKISAPAIAAAKSKEEEFNYLLVVAMRALAGHVEMQEFMDKNGYWSHPILKALIDKMSDKSKRALPTITKTKQSFDIAKEIYDILNPPKPPEPPAPPPPPEPAPSEDKGDDKGQSGESDNEEPDEGEKGAGESDQNDTQSEDEGQSDAKGEDDEDHSDEEQAGDDGEGDGEREHDDDAESDNASGGDEGEPEEEGDDEKGEGSAGGQDEEEAEDAADDAGSGDDDDEEVQQQGDAEPEDGDEGSSAEQDGENSDASDPADGDDEAEGQQGDEGEAEASAGDSDDSDGGEDAGASEDGDGDVDGDDEKDSDKPNIAEGLAVEMDDDSGDEQDQNVGGDEGEDAGLQIAGVGYQGPNPFENLNLDGLAEADLSSSIAILIRRQVIETMQGSDYTVFTREYDVIAPLEVPKEFDARHVVELDDQTRSSTGVMQKEIERMMAAQSRTFNYGGRRSGRLNGPGLHRIVAGDPRVFTQREEMRAKDTAVSLVIDCSGSMGGRKIATAMSSAYALSLTLERVNIPFECLGFTTCGIQQAGRGRGRKSQGDFNKELNDEMARGVRFCRVNPIYMPVFKEFSERVNADVKRRFAYQRVNQPGMAANIDGESLEYAAMRLAQRREKRKVIIVLSDGFPSGATNDDEHLRMMTTKLQNGGFDLVGIGIESDAVRRFYDKAIVLSSFAELPKAVMGELRQILTK